MVLRSLFSSNNGLLYLPGFQPPFIFTASDPFLPAVSLRLLCKTAAGKNKTDHSLQGFHLFDLFKFTQEMNRFIFRKLLKETGMGTGKLLPPVPTPAHPVVISAVPGAGASYK
jgi:hypothetical protein